MAIKFTATIPGGIDYKKFIAEIERSMQREGELIARTYARFFDSWKEKPAIKVRTTTAGGQATVQTIIYPEADEDLLQIAKWVIYGTPPHDIEPKAPGYPLRFPELYLPSTSPGVIQSQPSSYHGEDVRTYSVEHPGIEARDTINAIEDAWRVPFQKDMARATGVALAKAQKKPRKTSL